MTFKWFNVGVLGMMLTIVGLIWQAGAKLTRIEDSLASEREARKIEVSNLQSWLDDTRDRLRTLESTR